MLGRLRLRPPFRLRQPLRVGDPQAPDAMGSTAWRDYLDAERLYDVWGPHPDSAWTAFHCVPLFAALDSLRHDAIGPARPLEPGDTPPWHAPTPPPDVAAGPGLGLSATPPPITPVTLPELPPWARPGALPPPWLAGDTWTILDLPGPLAVQAAVWLLTSGSAQPVCTFDNWPHARGVLRAEAVLAELLRWASMVADARRLLHPASPPVWICDSQRLGAREPSPRDFDNRYYLDDSILPGPDLLRTSGLRRAVYVTPGSEPPLVDLDGYFRDLQAAGFPVLQVSLADPALDAAPLVLPAVPRRLPSGYRRSGAGGFGQDVPEPSSGGSGG